MDGGWVSVEMGSGLILSCTFINKFAIQIKINNIIISKCYDVIENKKEGSMEKQYHIFLLMHFLDSDLKVFIE